MKINFKARFKNPLFIAQLFLSIAAPIGVYFGVSGSDITTWAGLFALILSALSNPYVLFTVLVSVWAAVNDPLTKGASDSHQGLTYNKPKDDRITKGGKF